MRPAFGSDIDDTAIISHHVTEKFWEYLIEEGITHNREVYAKTHDWNAAIPDRNPDELYSHFVTSGRAPPIKEMPGARDALGKIALTHDVHFVTTRNPQSLDHIRPDLMRLFEPINIAGYWPCAGQPKTPVIKRLGIRYFVDDNIEVLSHLRNIPGLTLIQFPSWHNGKTPYVDNENMKRLPACDSVEEGVLSVEEICLLAWEQLLKIVNRKL